MTDLVPWKCQNGHILGLVRRNGSGVRQLILYRHAINPASERMEEVDVIAVVEGLVMSVRCDICGRKRTWKPGDEAFARLRRAERSKGSHSVARTL